MTARGRPIRRDGPGFDSPERYALSYLPDKEKVMSNEEPSTTSPAEQRLTIREVAAMAGVSASTVYNWRVNGGGPPGERVKGRVQYKLEDVQVWLESRR